MKRCQGCDFDWALEGKNHCHACSVSSWNDRSLAASNAKRLWNAGILNTGSQLLAFFEKPWEYEKEIGEL